MPSKDALITGLYCGQCGRDMPESRLFILYALNGTDWSRVGRYCDECLPREKEMEILNGATEVRTEGFVAAHGPERR